MTSILEKVRDADGIILASPVHLGTVTGAMRSFLERLVFPYLVYDGASTLFPRKINTGFIYTMNMTETSVQSGRLGLDKHISATELLIHQQSSLGFKIALISFHAFRPSLQQFVNRG